MQSFMFLLIVITLKYSEKHALPLKLPLGSFANLSSLYLFFLLGMRHVKLNKELVKGL